jgi:hypothetical protein
MPVINFGSKRSPHCISYRFRPIDYRRCLFGNDGFAGGLPAGLRSHRARPFERKGEAMRSTGLISRFRVTSHRMRYGIVQPERWFDRYEHAEAEVKKRLGLQRFHQVPRWTRFEYGEGATCQHDGFTWTCTSRSEYSQMPRSSRQQGAYGFVRVEELRRPSPPFVNPFAAKSELAGSETEPKLSPYAAVQCGSLRFVAAVADRRQAAVREGDHASSRTNSRDRENGSDTTLNLRVLGSIPRRLTTITVQRQQQLAVGCCGDRR